MGFKTPCPLLTDKQRKAIRADIAEYEQWLKETHVDPIVLAKSLAEVEAEIDAELSKRRGAGDVKVGDVVKMESLPVGTTFRILDNNGYIITKQGEWISLPAKYPQTGWDTCKLYNVTIVALPVVEVGDLVECLPSDGRYSAYPELVGRQSRVLRLDHLSNEDIAETGPCALSSGAFGHWPVRSLRIIEKG